MILVDWWRRVVGWLQMFLGRWQRLIGWCRWLKDRLWPEKSLGQKGEEAAARFLRRRGYRILARRSRSGWGELDLVALDGRTIVFVEVKTRRSTDVISPEEGVDWKKQHRLIRAAQNFLHHHGLHSYACRFDVVAVTWPADHRRPQIRHFPAAFQAGQ
jgi:putative endonuclease